MLEGLPDWTRRDSEEDRLAGAREAYKQKLEVAKNYLLTLIKRWKLARLHEVRLIPLSIRVTPLLFHYWLRVMMFSLSLVVFLVPLVTNSATLISSKYVFRNVLVHVTSSFYYLVLRFSCPSAAEMNRSSPFVLP